MLSLVGADASAAAMATAVSAAASTETRSKKELLENVGLFGLRNMLNPDHRVWQLLLASKKLKHEKHKNILRRFLYVDLAALNCFHHGCPKRRSKDVWHNRT